MKYGLKKATLLMAYFLCGISLVQAENIEFNLEQLDQINVNTEESISSDPLSGVVKPNDIIVTDKQLRSRSSTLGNALSQELGIHSNEYGGGASAPIIRGQEGVRLKILQNNLDVVDMSTLSPDHAIAVDTLLAKQVEVVRGASTLLYATASPAGVINVIDERIPTKIPEKGYKGTMALRYNTNNHENVESLGVTLGGGQHFALRLEGLNRHSQNYRVSEFKGTGQTFNYLPDSYNKSKVGTIGGSFIGDKGYIGVSYSRRQDKYGIPGHNHMLDSCSAHIFNDVKRERGWYLSIYPHLMEDQDLIVGVHTHCDTSKPGEKHDHTHGHIHTGNGPWVELDSKRYDLRSELKMGLAGIDKIRFSAGYVDYYHDERDGAIPVNLFKNKGKNLKFELFHQPIGGLTGVWGVQYQTQTSSANIPKLKPKRKQSSGGSYNTDDLENRRARWALVENTVNQTALFGFEQYRWNDFMFELSGRTEKQHIDIHYDRNLLAEAKRKEEEPSYLATLLGNSTKNHVDDPDLSPYKERANSYTGAIHWTFLPEYMLSFTASHNERLPTPMELYYHGQHLATNALEHGNKNLRKERSNNYELSLAYDGSRWHYHLSAYYQRFKNRIFNQTLARQGFLAMNRFTQSQAKYYGAEGQIDYDITPSTRIGVFADYVRGKLFDLPNVMALVKHTSKDANGNDDESYVETSVKQSDRNAPRVPPMRFGVRLNTEFNENWSGYLNYTRVFRQNKVTNLENSTKGYHLLNLGLNYRKPMGETELEIYADLNNALNQAIYSHTSFMPYVPQIGRNLVVGINFNF